MRILGLLALSLFAPLAACGTSTVIEPAPPPQDAQDAGDGADADVPADEADAAAGDAAPADAGARGANDGGRPPPGDAQAPTRPSGALDGSYGKNGCVTLAHAGDRQNNAEPYALAVDASGNAYVGGRTLKSAFGVTSAWFARLGASGDVQIDTTVDTAEAFLAPSFAPSGSGIAFLTEPRTTGGNTLVRTDLAGIADASFSVDGALASTFFAALGYQSTGELVALDGPLGTTDALVRLGPTGALDPAFGASGKTGLPFTGVGLAVDAQDRVYVAGQTSSNWLVARYTKDGALDASFGDAGIVDLGAAPPTQSPYTAIRFAGNAAGTDFYVVGQALDATQSYFDAWVVHLTPAGPDPSFGGAGHLAVAHPPSSVIVDALAVQPNGALVLGARDDVSLYVTRVARQGALDTSYATNGWYSRPLDALPGGQGSTTAPIAAIGIAPGGEAIVVQRWQYVHNLYTEAQAIVCRLTP